MESPLIKVLLVEDDEDDYVLVRRLLSTIAGVRYDLQWASTYEAALAAMSGGRHDVYLIDYQLGDRTGLELLREIGGKGSAVPAIFLTGHADYGVDMEAMRAGASDYLVKGQINGDLLERSIRYSIERTRLERQLRHSQKMEAVGTLAGGIAHDFNNILAAIIGFSEIASESVPEDSKASRCLKRVFDAGIRGRDLVKQILAFSRQSEQEKRPLRMSALVKETLSLLRSSLPSTIRIEFKVKKESSLVLADEGQIQQVVLNLCTNAAHAMREKGGSITLSLSEFDCATSREVAHPVLDPGPYLRLSVQDTGVGIPADVIHRIFDPFFTTKKQGEGTGLGLSVALGIVESHGGTITVESTPGKGSLFSVYLPAVEGGYARVSEDGEEMAVGHERVLFVDDEEALVVLGGEMLKRLGYDVTTIISSRDALALVKEDPDRFDLVLTDQTMPDLTGLELAHEILAVRPDMPIIMATGFSQIVDADMAKAAGIKAFVMKPVTRRELATTVRKVLDEWGG